MNCPNFKNGEWPFFQSFCEKEGCEHLMLFTAHEMPDVGEIYKTNCEKCESKYHVRLIYQRGGYVAKINLIETPSTGE